MLQTDLKKKKKDTGRHGLKQKSLISNYVGKILNWFQDVSENKC